MCPFSGLMQFLIVLFAFLLIGHSVLINAFTIVFQPKNVTIFMYDSINVNYTITDTAGADQNFDTLKLYSEDPNVAFVENEIYFESPPKSLFGNFKITGNFLGQTKIALKSNKTETDFSSTVKNFMTVIVVRKPRTIDTIFTVSIAILVSIIYINFGCALNTNEVLKTIRRPIGPTIGFACQYISMPIISFAIAMALFPDSPEMQLGLFFTGVSPSGGASNIWTVLLDGNVDLSITMTTLSTLAAFAMMPFWIFTLGRVIFSSGNLIVPYSQITTYATALIVPLAIGYLLSRYCKKISQFMVKILKGFSAALIVFIVVFAIVTNLYMFQLFSWKIILAGMGLPYLGYIVAYAVSKILKQPDRDCLAIAIETSIQNTGIAIFLLRFTLPQPQADLTTVAPVSVAMMTPIPLILFFLYKKIRYRLLPSDEKPKFIPDICHDNDMDDNFNKKPLKKEDHLGTVTGTIVPP